MTVAIDPPPLTPRATAIIIPVPELTQLLAPWRNATVPVAAKGVPPHITLLYPWRPPRLAKQDLATLRATVAGVTAFSITFAGVGRFSPQILFLRLADDSVVRSVMQAMSTAFPDTPPYGGAFTDPVPHLTVAQATTDAELDRLEQQLTPVLEAHLPLTRRVDAILVLEEDHNGNWQEFTAIGLAE